VEPHVDFRIFVDEVFELLNGWVKVGLFGGGRRRPVLKRFLERFSARWNPTSLYETLAPAIVDIGHVELVELTLAE
jgi:hypothetical protein